MTSDTKHDFARSIDFIENYGADTEHPFKEVWPREYETIRHALKLAENHERRVTELLASNNELLERARKAEAGHGTPDWFYCTIDPDECGDSAYEAMHGYRDRLTPVELGTSYHGGPVWGVMYPSDKDDGEEAATFDTYEEALAFCDERKAAQAVKEVGDE